MFLFSGNPRDTRILQRLQELVDYVLGLEVRFPNRRPVCAEQLYELWTQIRNQASTYYWTFQIPYWRNPVQEEWLIPPDHQRQQEWLFPEHLRIVDDADAELAPQNPREEETESEDSSSSDEDAPPPPQRPRLH